MNRGGLMDYRKEHIKLSKDFPVNITTTCGNNEAVPFLHRHDSLELNLVKKGIGQNIIGDRKYSIYPGDIFIINSEELHYAFSDGSLELLVICFEQDFINSNRVFDNEYLSVCPERQLNRKE